MEFIKKNKIIFGVATGILIIGLIFFFAFFGSSQKIPPPTTQQTTISPFPSSVSNALPSHALSPQEVAKGWYQATTPTYTILFPPDWKPNLTTVNNGGTTALFMPTAIAGSTSFPRLQIEVSPVSSAPSLQNRLSTLTPLHFSQNNVTLHGIPTTMLNGIMPFTFVNKGQSKQLTKTFFFFTHNNDAYSINYSYYVDENAPKNKQILDTMLASFEVK